MTSIREKWRTWQRDQLLAEIALTPEDLPSSLATDAEVLTALSSLGATYSTDAERDAAVATITTALGLKAPLVSPALTGVPTAPTAAQGTNTTQVATTAFTRAEVAALVAGIPEGTSVASAYARWADEDAVSPAVTGPAPVTLTLADLGGAATDATPAGNALTDAIASDGTISLDPGEYALYFTTYMTLDDPAPAEGDSVGFALNVLTGGAVTLATYAGSTPTWRNQSFLSGYTDGFGGGAGVEEAGTDGQPEASVRLLILEPTTLSLSVVTGTSTGTASYHILELLKIA